jgi:hypothetical protein
MIELTADIDRLARGAAAWASQTPAARSRLALETALTTAAAADAWTEVAVAIKQAAGTSAEGLARAEETATGPLVTLRLLLVTARALADIGRGRPGSPTGAATPPGSRSRRFRRPVRTGRSTTRPSSPATARPSAASILVGSRPSSGRGGKKWLAGPEPGAWRSSSEPAT